MTRCSKSIAANLNHNPALGYRENLVAMFATLSAQNVSEIMNSHIYKQFPEPIDWSTYSPAFDSLTEKVDGSRGWYSIKSTGEVMPESTGSTDDSAVAVVTNSGGVAWIPTQTAVDNEVYAEDAGLKRIALMGTRCFGEYVPKGKCKTCPLAGSCQVASFGKIAKFAAELDAETEKALNPEPVVEEPEVTEEVQEETSAPKQETPDLKEGWKVMTSVITTVCSKCEENIPAGSECINIRGKGNFHMGCAE
tara:strand:+ start:627 stop:1376 length:750 start_codon:yes stop_codon:yes gene_type:complete